MSLKDNNIFRNEKGAIDLASIMFGIIVIGLVGGVIAATVFAIIPWAQDRAAKQQLDSVTVAQTAYKAQSSDADAASSGFNPNSYASSEGLETTKLLSTGDNYCTAPQGKGYIAFAGSASGKVFVITDTNTAPKEHEVMLEDLELSGCDFLEDSLPDSAFVKRTSMTYKCDTTTMGRLNFVNIQQGVLTISGSDGSKTVKDYSKVGDIFATLEAGVEYKITFDGTYTKFGVFGGSTLANCIRSLDVWGNETGATTAAMGLFKATNLTSVPSTIPPTVTDISNMFNTNTIFNDSNVSDWDTSNIINMAGVFEHAAEFNQSLAGWDTSKVTNMRAMFYNALEFNQSVADWNTSEVTDMRLMFGRAIKFNDPNVSDWDTSKVIDMENMFRDAVKFDQPLNWDVSNVLNMSNMFYNTPEFNQPLDGWNVFNVTNMDRMLLLSGFNGDISSWKFNTVPSHSQFSYSIPANYLPKW